MQGMMTARNLKIYLTIHFYFNLPQDYASVYELATSTEFIAAISEFVPLADNQIVF